MIPAWGGGNWNQGFTGVDAYQPNAVSAIEEMRRRRQQRRQAALGGSVVGQAPAPWTPDPAGQARVLAAREQSEREGLARAQSMLSPAVSPQTGLPGGFPPPSTPSQMQDILAGRRPRSPLERPLETGIVSPGAYSPADWDALAAQQTQAQTAIQQIGGGALTPQQIQAQTAIQKMIKARLQRQAAMSGGGMGIGMGYQGYGGEY